MKFSCRGPTECENLGKEMGAVMLRLMQNGWVHNTSKMYGQWDRQRMDGLSDFKTLRFFEPSGGQYVEAIFRSVF